MLRSKYAVLLAALTPLLAGCLAEQVSRDGRNFRQSLLDLYTEQEMDNLIAAYENRPLVQLSYRALLVTDEHIDKLTASNEIDPTNVSTFARATGALMSTVTTFVDKVGLGGSAESDRAMAFHADPVVSSTDVYEYYRAFACSRDLFCVSENKPDCPVYLKKKSGTRWYWVPPEASGVFLQLAMKTTFMRGTETAPPITYNIVIQSADFNYDRDGWPIIQMYKQSEGGELLKLYPSRNDPQGHLVEPPRRTSPSFSYVITFCQPLPSTEGTLTVDLPNGRFELTTMPFQTLPNVRDVWGQAEQGGTSIKDGDPTQTLYARSNTYLDPADFACRPARFYSADYPPISNVSKPADLLRLEEAVKRFRSIPQWRP